MRILLIILATAVCGSGCTSFELTRVRNDIARQAPEARIGDGYAASFGGISLGLARWLAGLADDSDAHLATAVLSEIRRVQFGRYEINGSFDAAALRMPGRLRHYLEKDQWHHLATIREDSEAVWVVYKEEGNHVVDLLAVVMDNDELVLAKISGDLNAAVAIALSREGLDIPLFGEEAANAEHSAEDQIMDVAEELLP